MHASKSVRLTPDNHHQHQSPQAQAQRLSPDSQCQQLTSDCGANTTKPKSRWFYRCEQETSTSSMDGWGDDGGSPSTTTDHNGVAFNVGCGSSSSTLSSAAEESPSACQALEVEKIDLPVFERIEDNIYQALDRKKDKKSKHSSRMICECSYEDALKSGKGCDEECLNRLLYYECGPNCPCGLLCTNLRFQQHQYARVDAFPAGKKGFGLKANGDMKRGTFIMEYVGEVLTASQFRHRTKSYAKDHNHKHHYFMALKNDEVIDATRKGNISRFINHSCDPNCETQKWTVNGHLRIGFFTIKDIYAGEELTFDYKFQRYGKSAQKCYCGAANCRGYIDGGGEAAKKIEKDEPKRKDRETRNVFEDQLFDREFDDILSVGCLRNRDQVVTFGRLMLRADEYESRCSLLNLLMKTQCHILRLFIDLHGCTLLWSWMVDDVVSGDQGRNFQLLILDVLDILPIPHKDMLLDSRLLPVVERWSRLKSDARHHEDDTVQVVRQIVSNLISNVCLGIAYNFDENEAPTVIIDSITQIKHKCNDLLAKWALLKENFKIPKKLEKSKTSGSPSDSESRDKPYKIADKQTNSNSPQFTDFTHNGAYSMVNGLKGRLINSYAAGQNKHAVKRPLSISNAENDPSTKRIKEERRREFEAKFARQEERKLLERQRQVQHAEDEAARIAAQVIAASFNVVVPASSTTAFDHNATPTLSSSSSFPPSLTSSTFDEMMTSAFDGLMSTLGGCGGLTSGTPTAAFDESGVERPDSLFLQGAIPAELVHDSTTAQYWWMDRSSGVFVYPATDEQIIAYQLGDISSIPHFYHDPSTGLIHEVQVRMPSSTQQAPAMQSLWTSFSDNQSEINKVCNEDCSAPPKLAGSSQSSMEERVVTLTIEIATLHKQLECKQAELTQLMEQISSAKIAQQMTPLTPLNESTPVQPPVSVGKLPKSWRMARDTDGRPYYYHVRTKKTQWDLPTAQSGDENDAHHVVDVVSPNDADGRRQERRRAVRPLSSRLPAKKTLTSTVSSHARQAAAKRRRRRFEGLRQRKDQRKAKATLKLRQMASRGRRPLDGSGTAIEAARDREDGEILPEDEYDAGSDNKLADEEQESSRTSSIEEESTMEEDEDDVVTLSENLGEKISTSRQSETTVTDSPAALKTTPFGTTTAAADTSSEVAKKFKEAFKAGISNHIIKCLNPYRKADCKSGHITSHEDFKHLARKLTHAIMEKEMKHCHILEELKITDSVLHKAKDYIKRYMVKLGPVYKRSFADDL